MRTPSHYRASRQAGTRVSHRRAATVADTCQDRRGIYGTVEYAPPAPSSRARRVPPKGTPERASLAQLVAVRRTAGESFLSLSCDLNLPMSTIAKLDQEGRT